MRRFQWFRAGRILVSLGVLGVCLAAFSDVFRPVQEVGKVQFLPSLLRGGWGWGIAAAILLTTFLWGRWYCSSLCPLGTLQDLAGWLGRRLRLNHGGAARPNRRSWRYGLLGFYVSAMVGGMILPLALPDSFACFGRVGNLLFRPALVWVNTFLRTRCGWESLTPLEGHNLPTGLALGTGLLIAALLVTALLRGRVFCNLLCPVGGVLGLAARWARFPLRLDRERCVGCRRCANVCKSKCIDLDKKAIDFERCVLCGDCGAVCRVNAIDFGGVAAPPEAPSAPERREFLAAGAGLVLGGAAALTLRRSVRRAPDPMPVMPPGAGSFEHFHSRCTGCGLCMAACPGKTLTPAGLEYGWSGIGQPYLSFRIGKCEFDCTQCSNICPNGALTPLTVAAKQRRRVGMVEYLKNRCIVVTDGNDCGACAEHCPTGALQMVAYRGVLTIPSVIPELCIGCGSCEYICPALPEKAVLVHGLSSQVDAADPAAVLKKTAPVSTTGTYEFPF